MNIFRKLKRISIYDKKFIKGKCSPRSTWTFDSKQIHTILKATPIYIVAKDYCKLRKSGGSYVGRCVFCHCFRENDSHFRISIKKNIFKCFECGVGGSTSAVFLMLLTNKPFDQIISFINLEYHDRKFPLTKGKLVIDRRRFNDEFPF